GVHSRRVARGDEVLRIETAIEPLVDQQLQQAVLVPHVVEQAGLGEAYCIGDLLQGQPVEAMTAHQIRRRLDDLRDALLRRAANSWPGSLRWRGMCPVSRVLIALHVRASTAGGRN